MSNEQIEQATEPLAKYAHDIWSKWMRYLLSKSTMDSGCAIIPVELVERWTRQMNTEYDALPEQEKKSDREEAENILKVIRKVLSEDVTDV